jgi:Ni/Fe-hydrogenase subunit HybB-like protein
MNRLQQPDEGGRPVVPPSPMNATWRFYGAALLLGAIVLAAVFAFGIQLRQGIGVVGKNRPIMWSVYITNFVFWTGIGHGCILLAVSMRWMKVAWRQPLTRHAEVFALGALVVGSLFPILHLGRPGRFYWLTPIPKEGMLFPNFHAPLIWDFLGINTLLAGVLVYLFFHLLPDWALIRDSSRGLRRILAGLLAMGWNGSGAQWRRLDRVRLFVTALIGISAFVANMIQSRIFASTPNPVWQSPATTPYFILTALFSAVAVLILIAAAVSGRTRPGRETAEASFDGAGRILRWLGLLWFCFTVAETARIWHRGDPSGLAVIASKLRGEYAPVFWSAVLCCFVLPCVFLGIARWRAKSAIVTSAVAVVIGLWLDRFLFIVPVLAHPRVAAAAAVYSPTWVEVVVSAGAASGFALVCLVFAQLFPMPSAGESRPRE